MADWKVKTESFLWSWLVSIAMHASYYGLSGVMSVIQADKEFILREVCHSILFLFVSLFLYLYAAASDNVILHCSLLRATRDHHLWTRCSALMARLRRGKNKAARMLFERLRRRENSFHRAEKTWVNQDGQTLDFSFCLCHNILSRGSHSHKLSQKMTARRPTELTAWSGPVHLCHTSKRNYATHGH